MSNNKRSEELNYRSVMSIIKIRKWFLVKFVFIAVAIVVGGSYLMPYSYEAVVSLMPPKQSGSGGNLSSILQSFSGGGGITLGGMGKSNQSKLYADIMKSNSVANYIVDKAELRSYDVYNMESDEALYDYIRESIEVGVEKSGIIIVGASSTTSYFSNTQDKDTAAYLSAKIANLAVEGLDRILRDRNVSSAKRIKNYIEDEISRYQAKMRIAENELEQFQKKNKVLAIDEQTLAIVKQAVEIGSEFAKAKMEYEIASFDLESGSNKLQSMRLKKEALEKQYIDIQSGGLTENDAFAFPLNEVPSLLKQYARLFRERKILEQVMLYLETQRHQEAIQEKKDIPIVEILDVATIPEKRSAPNRKMMLILSFLLSAIASVSIVIGKAIHTGNLYIKSEEN